MRLQFIFLKIKKKRTIGWAVSSNENFPIHFKLIKNFRRRDYGLTWSREFHFVGRKQQKKKNRLSITVLVVVNLIRWKFESPVIWAYFERTRLEGHIHTFDRIWQFNIKVIFVCLRWIDKDASCSCLMTWIIVHSCNYNCNCICLKFSITLTVWSFSITWNCFERDYVVYSDFFRMFHQS